MPTWIDGKIISITHWTNNLFSIVINAKTDKFIAGQFSKIGLKINNKIIQRAYSYINSPNSPNLEFYISKVISGKLTTLLYSLSSEDTILISKESYGQFTINTIPISNNYYFLWMIATGTGISPYLSILDSFDNRLNHFSKIILVHATKYSKNLNYLHKMHTLKKLYKKKLIIQTILSQEQTSHSLYGRIPILIENNTLEKSIGLYLNNKSHIMLCGNPHMILDTKTILYKKYGIKNCPKNKIKRITQERYW
ncbi:ferredoxin--NADP reductase [Candidatus Blochmanniella vafra str. BVAF]|uniref:Flavodoxin/ferredoxin--NADP reductase n=1 Tax=Blochmanniella vafra (strain BVAF) TaxID=859654 RepID=E8Q779_BLOVB|nr:ferredoxin--NADP(+) reductase [Candidatus Blochmannia vafer]ADV33974.1 ferredoxin--NADP reductase [Candidatus Blochmannia vafer str. BVAF]